jgi:hypothetical protein
MTYTDEACPCGSGLITRWQYDKAHVPLFRTCRSCHQRKMAKYRDELRDKSLETTDAEIEAAVVAAAEEGNGTETTVGGARFTIDMKYKGQEHSTELPFAPDVIRQLALEASFRDQEIGELAKDILVSVFEKELVPKLLDE